MIRAKLQFKTDFIGLLYNIRSQNQQICHLTSGKSFQLVEQKPTVHITHIPVLPEPPNKKGFKK